MDRQSPPSSTTRRETKLPAVLRTPNDDEEANNDEEPHDPTTRTHHHHHPCGSCANDTPSSASSLQSWPSPTLRQCDDDVPNNNSNNNSNNNDDDDEERDETGRGDDHGKDDAKQEQPQQQQQLRSITKTTHPDLLSDALDDQSTISNTSLHDGDDCWSTSSAASSRDGSSDDDDDAASDGGSYTGIGIQAWPGSSAGAESSDPLDNLFFLGGGGGGAFGGGAASLLPFLSAPMAAPSGSTVEGAVGGSNQDDVRSDATNVDSAHLALLTQLSAAPPPSNLLAQLSTILEEDHSFLDSVYASMILNGSNGGSANDSMTMTPSMNFVTQEDVLLPATLPTATFASLASSFEQSFHVSHDASLSLHEDICDGMLDDSLNLSLLRHACDDPLAAQGLSSTVLVPKPMQSALDCIAALAFVF